MKWHCATAYRELKGNRAHDQYCPKHAHASSVSRRNTVHKYRIPVERIEFVRLLLSVDWSPEQISSVLTKAGASISHKWIYRYVAQDKRLGGKLYRHLGQGDKRYRKGLKEKAPTIKNAVSIDEQTSIVDNRERFGDRETGTVLGKHSTGVIVTILERKSRFYLAKKVASKSAAEVTKVTIEMLMPYNLRLLLTVAESW